MLTFDKTASRIKIPVKCKSKSPILKVVIAFVLIYVFVLSLKLPFLPLYCPYFSLEVAVKLKQKRKGLLGTIRECS